MDIVIGDDSGEVGHSADEATEGVIIARYPDLDRQLNIEVGRKFSARLEEFEFQPGGKSLLRNINQQGRNFGFVGQAPEEVAERLFDVFELFFQRDQVCCFFLFGLERLLEFDLGILSLGQFLFLRADVLPVAKPQNQ